MVAAAAWRRAVVWSQEAGLVPAEVVMRVSLVLRLARGLSLILTLCVAVPVAAFDGSSTLKGRLLHAFTGEPVAAAAVMLQETRQQATTAPDGAFTFGGLTPGRYHVVVVEPGFSSKHLEVQVSGPETTQDFKVEPELHFSEVVSVSAEPRDQFTSFQPTSVLAGQDLTRELASTVGATLLTQPGMALRSFGAAPARPVIRGLDGDRVLILEDGQRTGDLSSQSGDHGVTINPASASKIEVVRGPAMLMYGSNAIGGLVNVIADSVPDAVVTGVRGSATADLGSNAGQASGAADVWWGNARWALHAGGGGTRAGDYESPDGRIDNTQSRNGFGSVGLSWTGSKGYVGASYGYEDTRYGLPYVEDGLVELTPRRHLVNVKGEARNLGGFFTGVKGSFAARRYKHEEIVGSEVGTRFSNDTNELEVSATHRAAAGLSGAMGAWVMGRSFVAEGEEALSPPVDQRGVAAFLFEEFAWHHVTLQVGGRLDHASYTPSSGALPARTFTEFSGSVGLVYNPPIADHRTTYAISLARAARYPALEELYFFGPHPGNFAFEIGNPNLAPEHALGFDASFRWRSSRFSTEVTYFRNSIADYIFRNPVDESAVNMIDHGEFPVIEYLGRDSTLQGLEAHGDLRLAGHWFADFGADYVHGALQDTGEALPRIPPLRGRLGVHYQRNALTVGVEGTAVAKQDRVFGLETPTDGYSLLKLHASYSFKTGAATSTITARAENLTNELYRNHLSYVKDFVPEMGRTVKIVYRVEF
jgi:iron complex outermembrane recepter protein